MRSATKVMKEIMPKTGKTSGDIRNSTSGREAVSIVAAKLPSLKKLGFDPQSFLAKAGFGKSTVSKNKGQTIFAQGDAADSVFFY